MLRITRWSSLALLALLSLAAPSSAGQVRVTLTGSQFNPGIVSANVGDQIVWVWSAGLHTVTSGTDGSTTGDGLFNSGGGFTGVSNARFSWKSTAGSHDYYCTVHFSTNMVGTVNVAASGVQVSDFRLTELQFNVPGGQDLIEIANLGDAAGNLGRYRISVAAGTAVELPLNDILVPAGGRVVIHANATGANTATNVYLPTMPDLPTTGSAALYVANTRNTNLADATQLIDFVQWGAGGQANEATAVTANFWNAGDAITGVDAGHSIEFCGTSGDYGAGNWNEGTTPNFGTNGNCATPTVRSTWGRLKTLYR